MSEITITDRGSNGGEKEVKVTVQYKQYSRLDILILAAREIQREILRLQLRG